MASPSTLCDSNGFTIPQSLHSWYESHYNGSARAEANELRRERATAWRRALPIKVQHLYESLDESTLAPALASMIDSDARETFTGMVPMRRKILVESLPRVLKRYAVHDPHFGYAPGMATLTAFALLAFCGDSGDEPAVVQEVEEAAFWTIDLFRSEVLDGYYDSFLMLGSHVDARVMSELIADVSPQCAASLKKHRIHLPLVTAPWFLHALAAELPSETALRLWDWLLEAKSGLPLFAVALALLKRHAEPISVARSAQDIIEILKSAPDFAVDYDTILPEAQHIATHIEPEQLAEHRFIQRHRLIGEMEERREREGIVTMRSLATISKDRAISILSALLHDCSDGSDNVRDPVKLDRLLAACETNAPDWSISDIERLFATMEAASPKPGPAIATVATTLAVMLDVDAIEDRAYVAMTAGGGSRDNIDAILRTLEAYCGAFSAVTADQLFWYLGRDTATLAELCEAIRSDPHALALFSGSSGVILPHASPVAPPLSPIHAARRRQSSTTAM